MHTVRGIADLGLFRVIGQPNLEFQVDRAAGGSLWNQCGLTCRTPSETARGGQGRNPGAPGRAALRPGGALSGALPEHQGGELRTSAW